jgi:hypothetical protein
MPNNNDMQSLNYDALTEAIYAELAIILPPLANDPDVFGFAIFLPEDAGAACLNYTFGNESKMTAKTGSAYASDQRYSPIEWIPTLPAFKNSNRVLETLVRQFEQVSRELSDKKSRKAHGEFINGCARATLLAMKRHKLEGTFGTIWYRVLAMTDSEEPILAEAFETLNDGRARKEAAVYYK